MAGGNNNLIPADKRTPEERAALGKKGGLKSGETRRRKKQTRDLMRAVLSMRPQNTKKTVNALKRMGYDFEVGGEPTVEALIGIQAARRAMAGDLSSARFIYDYAQVPDLKATMERKRAKADAKQAADAALNDIEDLTVLADLLKGDEP